jgi:hypothetical protein
MIKEFAMENTKQDGVFRYEETADGVTITAVCGGELVIPAVIAGKQVTAIGHPAFHFCQCDWLTRITIPASVTAIGRGAFSRCASLSEETTAAIRARFGDGVL